MKITAQKWEEMQSQYMKNIDMSLADIAESLGISKQAVSAYAKAHNWAIRNARTKSGGPGAYPIPEQKRGMNLSPEAAVRQSLGDEILYVLAKKGIVRYQSQVLFHAMEGVYSQKTIRGAMAGNCGMTPTFYKTVMHKISQLPDYCWKF